MRLLDSVIRATKILILLPVNIILSNSLKKNNFIFYHIPRSGGRSLVKFFEFYFNKKVNVINDYKVNKKNNYKLSVVVRQLHKKEIKNTNFLIILRNPYERLVSRYYYLRNYSAKITKNSNIIQKFDLSFEKYLELNLKLGNDNLLTRLIVNKIKSNNILDFYSDFNFKKNKSFPLRKADFITALKKLNKFEVIIFEYLNHFNWIKYFTGLPVKLPFFKVNNFTNYEKIKFKKKYLKNIKYDLMIYNYFKKKNSSQNFRGKN